MTRVWRISLRLAHDSDCFWSLIAVLVTVFYGLTYGFIMVVTEKFTLFGGQAASMGHDPTDVGFRIIEEPVDLVGGEFTSHGDGESNRWVAVTTRTVDLQ